jgi:hypothetical protein
MANAAKFDEFGATQHEDGFPPLDHGVSEEDEEEGSDDLTASD